MTNPIIILGAGASHDYSPFPRIGRSTRKPPLVDHLVKPEFIDDRLLDRYPEVASLISEIAPTVLQKKKNLEERLIEIRNKLGDKPHRKRQFVSLQFYLRDLFKTISSEYYDLNNYKTLVTNVKDYAEGKACIVTFNYDTLFEKSIEGNPWKDINSYIRGDLKLIKLHGSHDWAYIGEKNREKLKFFGISNSFDYLKKYSQHLDNLRKENVTPYHIDEVDLSERELFRFPAIALPLPEKQDFICPNNHIDFLKQELEKTDRILIIGWSASDSHLIEILKDQVKQKVLVTIVSESASSAVRVKDKLKHITNFDFNPRGVGFSNFVISNDLKSFFH